jgi:hypothetical protein
MPERVQRIDRSLSAAAAYLIDIQSKDGAWRSDTYGPLKDGAALTPWVLHALSGSPPTPHLKAVYEKGVDYLGGLARSDGTIDEGEFGLSYPVYTAAGAVMVLSKSENVAHRRARDAWLKYLRQRQLTEDLGWQPRDREYGGWGYAGALPRKSNREPLTESNISATVFALEALRAADCPKTDPALAKARTFVERCQNYSADPRRHEKAFDDGGFFFIYDDPARNKAGVAGIDKGGRQRFFSYGSATADGLRCLLYCGVGADHPRVAAAKHWLESHFSATLHPGSFTDDRESKRHAVYFYYAWSAAKALDAVARLKIDTDRETVAWAEMLADELMRRQRQDGSWSNPAKFVHEDDPVTATTLAASTLAVCRRVLTR